ncbi:MAG: hypothetical protein ABSA91_00585 [Acidimicrobiales bacterium]|jgi:hypothetical protein
MKTPSIRPAILVLMALALSAPTISNVASGNDSAVAAGEHVGGAIVVSWFAVGLVGYLVDSYRSAAVRRNQHRHSPPQ